MPLDLINRDLVVVTGKGGVGKSSVSAALALCASAIGRRTLVCELDAKGDLARLLRTEPVDYSGREVRPGLVAMTMNAEKSLAEYMRVQARIPFVGRIGPLARVFEFVATAAPGVRELLSMGKLAWEARRPEYDLVIADATATGHVAGQLAAPSAIRELIGLGMIRDQLDWMVELLEDPGRTTALIVTTPEEMPVVETIDLVHAVRDDARMDVGAVVVNRVLPAPFTVSERKVFESVLAAVPDSNPESVVSVLSHALRRRSLASSHMARLRSELPSSMPVLLLPEMFAGGVGGEEVSGSIGVEHLAAALAAEAGW